MFLYLLCQVITFYMGAIWNLLILAMVGGWQNKQGFPMAADFCYNLCSYPSYFQTCIFQAKFQFIWFSFYKRSSVMCFSLILTVQLFGEGRMSTPTFRGYVIYYTKTPWIYTLACWFAPSSFSRHVIFYLPCFVVFDCCSASFTEPYLHHSKDLFPEWQRFSWAHHCPGTGSCLSLVHISLHLLVSSTYNQVLWEPSATAASFCLCYANSVIFSIYCHFITQPLFQATYNLVQQALTQIPPGVKGDHSSLEKLTVLPTL